LLKAGFLGLAIVGFLLFSVVAMNTRDLLWFMPTFKEVPVGITVHCYGKDAEVKPGEPAFEAVTSAVNDSMSGSKRWDQTSMSDATYEEYKTSPKVMVIELQYDPPAVVHSAIRLFKR
jgi:hypothetical protein